MDEESKVLDVFGQFLMTSLRDQALDFTLRLTQGEWKAPALSAIQRALVAWDGEHKELVRHCVALALDDALHSFLFQLGEQAEHIQVIVDGKNITACTDYLHWKWKPFGEEGWVAQYSRFKNAEEIDGAEKNRREF